MGVEAGGPHYLAKRITSLQPRFTSPFLKSLSLGGDGTGWDEGLFCFGFFLQWECEIFCSAYSRGECTHVYSVGWMMPGCSYYITLVNHVV